MSRHFYIETFGCQMNVHDSEKIAGLLAQRGMIPVLSLDDADLVILNTCSVREKAAQKIYSRLGEIKSRKRNNPDFLIGVVGCVAQQESHRMLDKAPFVDLVVGTHMYHALPDLLEELDQRDHRQKVSTEFLKDPFPVETTPRLRRNRFRASITIMEGCNKHCSFCIVPFTRGRERNRSSESILQEISRSINEEGYVEILLLGQTVNSYRHPTRRGYRFPDLLAEIAEIKGVERIRFTSPHPRQFDDATIALIGENRKICDQVHLPLQSGSTSLLRRMRRQYTRQGFLALVEKFRSCPRSIALSTDIIVGFPGETENDFEDTLSLVEAVQFESIFSFKYSPRPMTEAEHWKDELTESEKLKRLVLLQTRQKEIQLEIHRKRYLDRTFSVLVEGTARDGSKRFGRTTSNKTVNFPGTHPAGTFCQVRITDFGPNSLMGQAIYTA